MFFTLLKETEVAGQKGSGRKVKISELARLKVSSGILSSMSFVGKSFEGELEICVCVEKGNIYEQVTLIDVFFTV